MTRVVAVPVPAPDPRSLAVQALEQVADKALLAAERWLEAGIHGEAQAHCRVATLYRVAAAAGRVTA